MDTMVWLDIGARIAFTLAAIGTATFVTAYFIGSAWRATAPGRAVGQFFAVLMIIMVLVLIFDYWDADRTLVAWLALVLYSGLAVVMWRLVYVLIRTQRRERRERRDDDERHA